MKTRHLWIAILWSVLGSSHQAWGDAVPPERMKAAFLAGVARLKEQKKEIFNPETLPAVKTIADIQVRADLKTHDAGKTFVGDVQVTMQVSKDSKHIERFVLLFRDDKWTLTEYLLSATIGDHPPKAQASEPLTQVVPKKVQACFNPP